MHAQVDAAKVTEWNTWINKGVVRLVPPSQAKWIKEHQADRIMGGRFVITKKAMEDVIENILLPQPDNPEHWKIKARFCLQGHLDPDLSAWSIAKPHLVTDWSNGFVSVVIHQPMGDATR